MKIEISFDLSKLDTFALLFLGQTALASRSANPEFFNVLIGRMLDEWARRSALLIGREAPPPARSIIFELSLPEAAFAVPALALWERTLRIDSAFAWHGPAAEFIGTLREAIAKAAVAETAAQSAKPAPAAPAAPKKPEAPISIHGPN